MHSSPAMSETPVRARAPARLLKLAGRGVALDRGGVAVIAWPDAGTLAAQAESLCGLQMPVVRLAGGALISDLSLQDNLMLEPALNDGVLPSHLLPEIDALFSQAGCPVDWPRWVAALPQDATALDLLQLRVGRALVADPDVLLIDAQQWDDTVLAPALFSRCFASQYPWRLLVWATHDAARQLALDTSLQELTA